MNEFPADVLVKSSYNEAQFYGNHFTNTNAAKLILAV